MILEDQTTVLSCNIKNPKLTVQQYVLEDSVPHSYCCKCFIELTMLTLFMSVLLWCYICALCKLVV